MSNVLCTMCGGSFSYAKEGADRGRRIPLFRKCDDKSIGITIGMRPSVLLLSACLALEGGRRVVVYSCLWLVGRF